MNGKLPSKNSFWIESRARKEKMMKWIFQTLTKDHDWKSIINHNNLEVVSGDKESCVVLMNKTGYQYKLQKMVDDGIKNGIYKVAEDNC